RQLAIASQRGAGERALAVAQPYAIEPRPVQYGVAQGHRVGRELRARTERHGVRVGVVGQHVQRRAAADPEAATLADGVAVDATVLADPPAARIEEIPGALA